MKAKDLKVGMRYDAGKSIILEITSIDKLTDKAITFTVKRISPNPYSGLWVRKNANTEIEIIGE